MFGNFDDGQMSRWSKKKLNSLLMNSKLKTWKLVEDILYLNTMIHGHHLSWERMNCGFKPNSIINSVFQIILSYFCCLIVYPVEVFLVYWKHLWKGEFWFPCYRYWWSQDVRISFQIQLQLKMMMYLEEYPVIMIMKNYMS